MPVGVDHDVDEVGIVEARRGALERPLVEPPVGRPELPQEPADVPPVLLETGTPALGVEVPLVPGPVLVVDGTRLVRPGQVLDVVAANRH